MLVATVYSHRKKRNVSTGFSTKKHGEEEAKRLLDEWKASIKEDNKNFNNDKNDPRLVAIEPRLQTFDDINDNLDKISVDEVLKKSYEKNTGNVIQIIASSKAGKTFLMLHMLDKLIEMDDKLIPIFMIGNRNAPIYGKYEKKYPFFDGINSRLIEALKIVNSYTDKDKRYKFLFIIDDILNMKNMAVINNLTLSYRNSMLSTIMCLQSTSLLFKMARSNATIYFFGQLKSNEVEQIVKLYLKNIGIFSDIRKRENKERLYINLAVNHNFIVWLPNIDTDKLYITKII